MAHPFKQAAGGLTLALGVGAAGCGGEAMPAPQPPQESSVQAVEASIERSLSRLASLELVTVERLVVNLPSEAYACYGLLCAEWKDRDRAERARQAPRLERLAGIAETVARDPTLGPRSLEDGAAAVHALAGLAVVEVGTLVQVQPKTSASCYNLVCPSDQEAADAENGRRVGRVFAIVDEAKKSGL